MARQPPKTRLTAGGVPREADRRRLYAAFLEDTINACRTLPATALRVAYTPDGGRHGFEAFGVSDAELLSQRGVNLGERERAVFEDLFAEGFTNVIMVGSDLPTLPVEHIRSAFARLQPDAVVLGPSTDGGYYLVGLRCAEADIPDLFSNIRWSTPSVFGDTRAAARAAGLRVELVPQWYDVDDQEGLARLRMDLRERRHADRAPVTAAVVEEIFRG